MNHLPEKKLLKRLSGTLHVRGMGGAEGEREKKADLNNNATRMKSDLLQQEEIEPLLLIQEVDPSQVASKHRA